MKKKKESLTVQKFIEVLSKLDDIDIANMSIYCGDKNFEIESIGQMGLTTAPCQSQTIKLKRNEIFNSQRNQVNSNVAEDSEHY